LDFFKNKNIAVIAPDFFGYPDAIKKSILAQGGSCEIFDERPSNDFLTKVLLRIGFSFLLASKIEKYYTSLIDKLVKGDFDTILIISPESILPEHIKKIKSISNAKVIIYMWDSIKNKPKAPELFSHCDDVVTFDMTDAEKYSNVRFLPLFYELNYDKKRNDIKYDICFIGTVHSDRYKIIKSLTKTDSDECLSFYKFMYMPSRALYLIRKYILMSLLKAKKLEFSFDKISSDDIANIFSSSTAILDINHPGQRGLTSRTFEALGSGCKLITTNEEIKKYEFYHEDNICVIDRHNPVIKTSFLKSPMNMTVNELITKNTLDNWIRNVVDDSEHSLFTL